MTLLEAVSDADERASRLVDVDLFVYSCPADALQSLIATRKAFADIREEVVEVLVAHRMGVRPTIERCSVISSSNYYDCADAASGEEAVMEAEEEEGAAVRELISRIDELRTGWEEEAVQLMQRYAETKDIRYVQQQAVFEERICRLDMYMGLMISEGVAGAYGNSEVEDEAQDEDGHDAENSGKEEGGYDDQLISADREPGESIRTVEVASSSSSLVPDRSERHDTKTLLVFVVSAIALLAVFISEVRRWF